MTYLAGFLRFWRDLLIGDDWTVAAGVVLALAIAAVIAHSVIIGWLWLPVAVAGILTESLWRAARASERKN